VSVRLSVLRNPFTKEREELQVEPGRVGEYLEGIGLHSPHSILILNDEVVGPDCLAEDGDHVIIRAVPMGGDPAESMQKGGIASITLGTVMVIVGAALIVSGVGAPLGIGLIAGGVGAWVGGGGLIYAGANLPDYNIESQNAPNFQDAPGLRGSRNAMAPGAVIPVVFGSHYVVPPNAGQPYTTFEGNDQFLHQLFVAGYSDLMLSEFQIAETPLSSFVVDGPDDVQHEVLEGSDSSTLYSGQVVVENVGVQLSADTIAPERGVSAGPDEIHIDLVAPRGMCGFDGDGNPVEHSELILVEVVISGGSEQSEVVKFRSSELAPIRKTVSFSVDRESDSTITVTKTSPEIEEGDRTVTGVTWTIYRTVVNEDPLSDFAKGLVTRVGLKIRATDQLNGVVDRFNFIASARVPDYTGSGSGSGSWVQQETKNPASAFLWVLRGPMNADPTPDADIDWESLEAWHSWCAANEFECNAVLDRGIPMDRLLDNIASTGRASWSVQDGVVRIIQDVLRSGPVQMITPRNAWGFAGAKAYVNMPHGIKVGFVNEDVGYREDEVVVYDDGYGEGNATKFESVKLWGVTKYQQAWRQGRYILGVMKLRPERFSVMMDVEHLICQRGDQVLLQYPDGLVGTQAGRVTAVTDNGTSVTYIKLDEVIPIDPSKSYSMRVRGVDGSLVLVDLVTPVADSDTFEVSGSVPVGDVLVGDVAAVGIPSLETVKCLVSEIEPNDDLTAKLVLVVDHPSVYTADEGTIPEFESSITPPTETRMGRLRRWSGRRFWFRIR